MKYVKKLLTKQKYKPIDISLYLIQTKFTSVCVKRKVKNGMNDASEKQILFRNGNRKQRETKVTLHIKERNREKL